MGTGSEILVTMMWDPKKDVNPSDSLVVAGVFRESRFGVNKTFGEREFEVIVMSEAPVVVPSKPTERELLLQESMTVMEGGGTFRNPDLISFPSFLTWTVLLSCGLLWGDCDTDLSSNKSFLMTSLSSSSSSTWILGSSIWSWSSVSTSSSSSSSSSSSHSNLYESKESEKGCSAKLTEGRVSRLPSMIIVDDDVAAAWVDAVKSGRDSMVSLVSDPMTVISEEDRDPLLKSFGSWSDVLREEASLEWREAGLEQDWTDGTVVVTAAINPSTSSCWLSGVSKMVWILREEGWWYVVGPGGEGEESGALGVWEEEGKEDFFEDSRLSSSWTSTLISFITAWLTPWSEASFPVCSQWMRVSSRMSCPIRVETDDSPSVE